MPTRPAIEVEIIAQEVADEMLRLKVEKSVLESVMYLRSQVGSEFDELFHKLMRRVGENRKKASFAR